MVSTTGIQALGTYAADGTAVATLLALLADPDTSPSQSGGGFLDEMSPSALVQLRVELAAMQAAGNNYRVGSSVMSAGEVTATLKDIVTGLADLTLANCIIAIKRAGVNVTRDAVITEPVAGTIRVAAGTNYVMTAGDVVSYYAR